VLVVEIARASQDVAATSSRLAKTHRLATLLRSVPPAEAATVVSWLAGELPQRQIGVGWAALRSAPPAAPEPVLTVAEVDATFTEIGATAGPGSQSRRAELLQRLFAAASAQEQLFLRRLLGGELRQGALVAVMADAVGRAANLPAADVRRAAMLCGDLPTVAAAALSGGASALSAFRLQVGRALSPMLAQSATNVAAALIRLGGEAVFEAKLDGVRVQIHRSGRDVAIFTRSLDDVTARLPEVVERVLTFPGDTFVLDGEAAALRPDGRLQPFQVTSSRFGRSVDVAGARARQPLHVFCFDLLHLDGENLLDRPMNYRASALAALAPASARVDHVVTPELAVAEAFFTQTLLRGYEGVMAKAPAAPYEAGRRGAGWLKVKPIHTLDLVVLAVEWGSGRRTGKLSNIHLGARDPASGQFVMLGKTFKGLTDVLLSWQTVRFLELAEGPTDGWVVRVRPEQVVEIAFDGVQRSSRYPGGVALRFARVLRYRDDKAPADADTLETVRRLLSPG
jgi:DNA ligase-1